MSQLVVDFVDIWDFDQSGLFVFFKCQTYVKTESVLSKYVTLFN